MAQEPGSNDVRIEVLLAGLCSVGWGLAILAAFGWLPIAGKLPLGLYRFFSLAAVSGWLIGNIYVFRKRGLPAKRYRRRAMLLYLIGPPSFLYVVRAMAPLMDQRGAPLVPLLGFAVYCVFFLLPVTLQPPALRRPK